MKSFKYYLLLLLTLFIITACSTSTDETPIAIDNTNPPVSVENQNSDKIVIASMEIKPFKTIVDGELTGPYIDIIKTALDNLGYEYEFQIMPWNRVIESIQTGDINIGLAFFDTPERRKFAYYMEEPISLYSMKLFAMPNSNIEFDGTLKSIDDYSLGLVQNYFYTTEITDAIANDTIKVDEATDGPTNIEKLLNGRVDLIIEDNVAVNEYFRSNNIDVKLKEFEIPIIHNYTYLVFPKDEDYDDLRRELDLEFKAMKSDGSFYDIYREYDLDYFADYFASFESSNPARKKYFAGFKDAPLSIGVIADTKPYVYQESGELTGFIIDFLSEALDRVGPNYEFIDMPFSRMLEELENGSLDIAVNMKSTGEYIANSLERSDEISIVNPPIFSEYSSIVFSKENELEVLLAEYEYAVNSMREDGTLKKLYEKYNLLYFDSNNN